MEIKKLELAIKELKKRNMEIDFLEKKLKEIKEAIEFKKIGFTFKIKRFGVEMLNFKPFSVGFESSAGANYTYEIGFLVLKKRKWDCEIYHTLKIPVEYNWNFGDGSYQNEKGMSLIEFLIFKDINVDDIEYLIIEGGDGNDFNNEIEDRELILYLRPRKEELKSKLEKEILKLKKEVEVQIKSALVE